MKQICMFLFSLSLVFLACDSPSINDSSMLDGDFMYDVSLYEPENYLVSAAISEPTPEQLQMPVVIASHGYSATTFEWDEFHAWTRDQGGMLVSRVLLGGHGRDYQTFKHSTWQDWLRPIQNEYERLVELGYQHISFLASSTSCALLLELLNDGYFQGMDYPEHFLFVDPIIISSDKLLSLIGIVGPMLGYIETEPTDEERRHWYTFRPQETLQELQTLLTTVRKDLQSGINLESHLKVYKSKKDESADPVSAVLIYKGVKGNIEVEMVDSDLHVFTRLAGRGAVSQRDVTNQMQAFQDIRRIVLNSQ
ncbi:MAG: esterase [candidate division KSB1 bacterium]|nr:esterase [candidate division KSB1 bacterium]